MSFSLNRPRIVDERFDFLVQFIHLVYQQNPQANELISTALAHCSDLRTNYPDDPAIWQLSSIVARIIRNKECSCYFLGQAILLGLDTIDTRDMLNEMIATDDYWANTDTYLSAAKSRDGLIDQYKTEARRHFDLGDLITADNFSQRISALRNPSTSEQNDMRTLLAEARARQSANTLNAQYENTVEHLHLFWSTFDVNNIASQLKKYAITPDREQFSKIVSDLIHDADKPNSVVMEVGCFAGFNLNEVQRRLPKKLKNKTHFIGIEPNAEVVTKARVFFPDIEFRVGDHEAMIARQTVVPDHIDVCIISRVLMVMLPSDVERLLHYLAPRTDTLVICDDIFNLKGEMSVVRTPPNFYLLHNFSKMLTDADFSIDNVILADVPDRECTGFIIASGLVEGF